MTKRILSLVIVFAIACISVVNAQKLAIYGDMWENGTNSECNWYFKANKACMQYKFKDDKQVEYDIRVIMTAGSNQLKVVTFQGGQRFDANIPVDSVRGSSIETVSFFASNSTKEFQNFGDCKKYIGRTHMKEYMAFTFENPLINLSQFKSFIKNDPVFEWFSSIQGHQFPVQAITASSDGQLIRSYLAKRFEADFSDAIFE